MSCGTPKKQIPVNSPDFPRPRVVISRCLTFDHCRWDGGIISSSAVDMLKKWVDVVTPCPETDLGLGIPREPIRQIMINGELRLMQRSGADITEDMTSHLDGLVEGLSDIDGFILKEKSPSCGLKKVKVYPRLGKCSALTSSGMGFFGRRILQRWPHIPMEDEGRLLNYEVRDIFLTRIFTLARFRAAAAVGTTSALMTFQARHKYLLMAMNQQYTRILGRITANHEKKPLQDVLQEYYTHLCHALSRNPKPASWINVFTHIMGHFSSSTTSGERAFLLETFEKYRQKRVPVSVPINMLKGLVIRFDDRYLSENVIFEPFPEELIEVTDSGKGRAIR